MYQEIYVIEDNEILTNKVSELLKGSKKSVRFLDFSQK